MVSETQSLSAMLSAGAIGIYSLFAIYVSLLARSILGAFLLLALNSCGISDPVTPPPVSPGTLPRVLLDGGKQLQYLRTVQSGVDTFSIQTGSRLLRKAGSPDIDLVGAMHVAEPEYYRKLQSDLNKADLVLFEAVIDESKQQAKEVMSDAQLQKVHQKSILGRFASSQGLVSQHTGINYDSKRFRRCDMSAQQMDALLKSEIAKGGSVAQAATAASDELALMSKAMSGQSWAANSIIGLISMSPALKARMRLMLVASGSVSYDDEALMHSRLERLISEDRNAFVMKEVTAIMRKEKGHQRIAIFYGAAHLADLQKRFAALGYRPVESIRWYDAAQSHPYAAGITEEEVKEVFTR